MIEISNFSFKYRESDQPVVSGIELTIPDGAFVGITGAAGSGKSTLTYALNGIIPHCYPGDFYGSVTVDGLDTCDVALTDVSQVVGSVCQDVDSQFVTSIVEDEVLYGLENFGVPRDEIEGRVSRALADMGISDLRDRVISSLSGGQKQKVAIASILALNPRVLVLDEPTTGLDFCECEKVMAIIRRIHEQGATVIMVCHDMEVVADYATRCIVMSDGTVVDDAPTFDVLRNRDTLERASLVPPQIVDLSLELARDMSRLAETAVGRANTVDEMLAAVSAEVRTIQNVERGVCA